MVNIGTPLTPNATRMMLLGSGELGKEVAIEAQRFGVEVIAVDRYAHAPAMQVAHRSHVINMLDGNGDPAPGGAGEAPLHRAGDRGHRHAHAAGTGAGRLDRDPHGAHRAAHHGPGRHPPAGGGRAQVCVPRRYQFADTYEEFRAAIKDIGLPCVVKPVMSSSGKGQSVIKKEVGNRSRLAVWPGGRPQRQGPHDRGRLRGFRLRDHPAHGAPCGRHHVSASPSATARNTAITANPGSPSPWRESAG